MPAKRQNFFLTLWEQSRFLSGASSSTLSAAEQTRLSWARPIKTFEAVPEYFKAALAARLVGGQDFPYAVLTPSYEGFIHRETEKLVCDLGDELCILERSGDACVVQSYPLDRIDYVEVRILLLDSRIKISGMGKQGLPQITVFRFNTVTDYLFTPILEKVRSVAVGPREPAQHSELAKFNAWGSLSFKFMNYARSSLLGREKVLQTLLQPEIKVARFSILGEFFQKTISPTHATILTDRELILIREEHIPAGGGRYGGTWNYLPINKIAALALKAREDGLLLLSVTLPNTEPFEFLFQEAARPEIDQLLEQFGELNGQIVK